MKEVEFVSPMDRLDSSAIEGALATKVFGRQLVVLCSTGSTNDVAREMAIQGALEGLVVLADEQTSGRGRMGRRWVAPPGTCLLGSVLFRPSLPAACAQQLTMLCSLAAADAISQVAGLSVALKWPNDLVVCVAEGAQNWKKLAGVLTETAARGATLEFVVVGIGVNVNVDPTELIALAPDATSILAETGRWTDRTALIAAFLTRVEQRYRALQAGIGPYREWAARLATLGRCVRVTTPGEAVVGVAESVDEEGALLLRVSNGQVRRFLVGDVTLGH